MKNIIRTNTRVYKFFFLLLIFCLLHRFNAHSINFAITVLRRKDVLNVNGNNKIEKKKKIGPLDGSLGSR